MRSFVIRASSMNHKLLQWLIRWINHKLISFKIFESYNEKSIESGSNQEIGNMIGYFEMFLLRHCSQGKGIFYYIIFFWVWHYEANTFLMQRTKDNVHKEKKWYKIFFWVIHYETNTFWMQMNYGIFYKQNKFLTVEHSFEYYIMKEIL